MFLITILSDSATWISPWINRLLADWTKSGYQVNLTHKAVEVTKGDFCFILSYSEVVKQDILCRNKHNLVVHESDLPKGKGWSPLSWQILEGKNTIVVTLFEATEKVDSGAIYLQEDIQFRGNELVDELRQKQADVTIGLCKKFINLYPDIVSSPQKQIGEQTIYPRRTPVDSQLDPNKTIAEQFNLLRIVDNGRYPAHFDWLGQRYFLRIDKNVK